MYFMEKEKIFLNKEVSDIVGITQRQVLSWTEKGLVIPFKESTGAGTKRGYDYVNCLEFGLCKTLFYMGIGFRAIKRMLSHLKLKGLIEDWAINFSDFHMAQFLQRKEHLLKTMKELQEKGHSIAELEVFDQRYLTEPDIPDKPTGVLLYFFDDEGEHMMIVPWESDYVLNLNITKEYLTGSEGGILVDIGKIKSRIDRKV